MAEVSAWSATDASNTDLFPENMSFSAVNDGGRAVQGAIARWFKDINGGLASSGSSNAFAVTSNRTISSLVDGIRLTFRANHAITGAATLNLNAIGAKDIKRFNGDALASGDIVSGQPVDVIYSSSLDDWIMVSALAALTGNMFADFAENATPGDPAADTARVYAKDDSGTTRLAYRDSAGSETVLVVPARAYAEYTANSNITTVISVSTVPQISDGTQILSAAITLERASSRVRARFQGFASISNNDFAIVAALFQTGTSNALAATAQFADLAAFPYASLAMEFEHAPGSVGPHTYTVRAGPAGASTIRFNGTTSGAYFSGAARATLVLEEVLV